MRALPQTKRLPAVAECRGVPHSQKIKAAGIPAAFDIVRFLFCGVRAELPWRGVSLRGLPRRRNRAFNSADLWR